MKNILVTGGAGFIGSNFIRYMLETESDVSIVNLDALTYASCPDNLKDLPCPEQYTFVEGDICNSDKVNGILHNHTIDTIVHFAAETHVDRSIIGPGQFVQTNVVGTMTLLESARKYWLDDMKLPVEETRFHHISTDEVFGSLKADEPAWNEKTPYAPNSPYSASKAASDHLVRAYGHTYDLNYTITNCSNNYGPYQFPEKLIPLMIINALEGSPLPVYGDGGQIRDWLYVEDHCEAIRCVLRDGVPGETYTIGGNNQIANLAVVRNICDILDKLSPDPNDKPRSGLIRFVEDRPGHDRRYAMDTTKMTDELGWQPKHSFENGLKKTIEWYLNHKEWIEMIRSRHDYQHWMKKNYAGRQIMSGGI